uniref:NADH-ubiquinone oxidoreductase chain 5 n=1 Tax=Modiolus modiolus TaxID=40256 RepID=A0A1L7H859_MODMO|nr:NADH dehydrogenase subunit 5 [Modiolus modiolus]APU51266.1 NADH dehydrogenase subunit 5 [Modiolus modiolus]
MIQFSKVLGMMFLVLGVMLLKAASSCVVIILEFSLWLSYLSSVNFSLFFDCSGLLFISTVLLISGSVLIYCSWYMDDEVYYKRFIFLVLLFVGSMVLLISIPNLICLLIGWDGLGITSFLLVVYYQNNKSLGAGMVTALVNRIGDVLLLFVIGALVSEGSWLLYESCLSLSYFYVPIILMFGAITKSAQMPFSAWLPAAMAAPTPVSSLVHSSTLVTAGVYLLFRCNFLLLNSSVGVETLKVLSLVTLVMAGSSALVEVDLKKVIALSTLSQLSMMLFALSLGLVGVSFFHLVTHASFKALLFLCAGVVIHSNHKCQDIRFLGKSWPFLPISMSCLVVANMSLCGVPFLSGFYSKDLIIELSLVKGEAGLIYFLEVLGTLFTSWYSFRLMLNLMYGMNKGVSRVSFSSESNILKIAYSSLLVSSVLIGWVLGLLVEQLNSSVHLFSFDKSLASTFVFIAVVSYGLSILYQSKAWSKGGMWFLATMWNLKSLTTQMPSKLLMAYSNAVVVSLEKGWLEKVGPQGTFKLISGISKLNQGYQQYQFLKVALLSLSFMALLFLLSLFL